MDEQTRRWIERLALAIVGGITTAVMLAFILGAFNLTVEVRSMSDSVGRMESAVYQLVEPKVERLDDPAATLSDEQRKRFAQMKAFTDWFDRQRE